MTYRSSQHAPSSSRSRKGLSTFGVVAFLAVVIGVGSSLFVARSQQIEMVRVSEAFEYLAEIQSSQQRFFAQTGQYADKLVDLDLSIPAPAHFSIGCVDVETTVASDPHWCLTLQRAGVSPVFGDYRVTFDNNGFNVSRSSLETSLLPCSADSSLSAQRMTLAKLDR